MSDEVMSDINVFTNIRKEEGGVGMCVTCREKISEGQAAIGSVF